ncbi:hypothetical protein J4E85_010821 [Alternaria conjuncta]|uniref:uncharacterized protein n=1 Tax=Alternaria conjuncta TaxID=181017 RepID=UPI00221FD468|nr:uncharacterized protein J4E85_010821 [Alternaria conjuncta]KAI4913367.1 hypothetical protein J4E85_010821 [Alternaria conjuncta]
MARSATTVIIGAGINGLATAFYLASACKTGETIVIVETSPDVVSSASGKANGVLSDYGRIAPTAELAHLSWKLHQQLAITYEGAIRWGYAKTVRHKLLSARDPVPEFHAQYPLPEWIRRRDQYCQVTMERSRLIDLRDTRKFIEFLRQKCEEFGVKMLFESEVHRVHTEQEELTGVTIKHNDELREVECATLVIAAGSWSGRVLEKLFPSSSFQLEFEASDRSAGNWLILKAPRPSNTEYCHQVYVENVAGAPVEISDYRDGRLYVGGYVGDTEIMPATAVEVIPQAASIAVMKEIASQFVDIDDIELAVLETGRCYRPILAEGRPIIAKIPMRTLMGKLSNAAREPYMPGGVYVNTGQGTSGICMGPGSGLVMSELIRGLQPSADVSGLNLPA